MLPVLTCIIRGALVAGLALLSACASTTPPVFATTPGPETPTVVDGIVGHFALAHHDDGEPCLPIQAVARGGKRRCLLYQALARPDTDSGLVPENDRALLVLRLRYDGNDYRDRRFMLIRRRCDTAGPICRPTEQTIATWHTDGGALYRKSLALSPDGRWLALLPSSSFIRLNGFMPPAPEGYHFSDHYHVGEVVLVDLESGAVRNTGIAAIDEQPLTWSSDGRRLLMVRTETIATLTPWMRDELRGSEGVAGNGIPVIESWDVATNAVDMLAIGFDPLWSPDQQSLLFHPVRIADVPYYAGDDRTLRTKPGDACELRDLVTGTRRDVTLPGLVGPRGAIAFVGATKVLYWALPTVGTSPSSTVRNSPLIGPKQTLALKVGDFESQQFATVVPKIDPRAQVGFTGRY